MKKEITINGIERESEKAVKVIAPVSWNDNAPKERAFWFPKSLIGKRGERTIEVEDWFLGKLESENAFHGYQMRFDTFAVAIN